MKTRLLLFLIGLSAAGWARAQAPSSLAGLTYRSITQLLPSGETPHNTFRVLELKSDGTYVDRLELSRQAYFEELTYHPLVNGTYAYTLLSATQASLTLSPAGGSQQTHSLTFTDSAGGTIVEEFGNFAVSPTVAVGATGGLRNVSTLVSLLPGNSTTVGFIVGGTQLKEYLIRCVGPTLGNFGVSNSAADPTYTLQWGPNFTELFQLPGEEPGSGVPWPVVGWSATADGATTIAGEAARVNAFPLLAGSNDKADVILLPPGSYTLSVAPANGAEAGAQLIEVYEVP